MAFRKVLFLALAIASASAAPQNVVLRAVPFGSVPTLNAVPVPHAIGAHHIVQQPAAVLPAVRTVAVAPAARAPVVVEAAETEIVNIDPSYRFGYSVADAKTGDAKSREETRDGNSVTGFYTVADPDGRIRRVTYTADAETGFNAVVTYDGEAGPPAIPIAGPVVSTTTLGEAPTADNSGVIEVRQPTVVRTVPANNLAVQRIQTSPTVVTNNAAHVLHTAAVPHNVVHQVAAAPTTTLLRNADGSLSQHQLAAAPTATFLRNADGSLSQVNLNQFHGVQTVPLNSGLLRAFPSLNIAGQHLLHVQ